MSDFPLTGTFPESDQVPLIERSQPTEAKVTDWYAVAEQCRNTTRWVVVHDVNKSYAWRIRKNYLKAFRQDHWDVVVRRIGGERAHNVTLYIRKV